MIVASARNTVKLVFSDPLRIATSFVMQPYFISPKHFAVHITFVTID